jgi:hypothetical protein
MMNEVIEPHDLETMEQKLAVAETDVIEAATALEGAPGDQGGFVVPSLSGFAGI